MNKKSLLIIFIILLVIVSGFFVYRNWLLKIFSDYQNSLILPQEKPEIGDALISEANDKYEIDVKYPEFKGLTNSENFNKVLEGKFQSNVEGFKSDADENSIEEVGAPSQLQIGYEVMLFTNNVVSLRFNTLYYIAGMAHPNAYYESVNYDFKNNKEIVISDLFNSGIDYLLELSNISRDALKKQIESDYYSEDFVLPGTEPKEENFTVFNFDKDKLIITFNPYQVGPWVLGAQFVEVPFDQLQGFNAQSDFLK